MASAPVSLPAPFEMLDEHVTIELPGARALFTTRRGGFSAGPYESLNLGGSTRDDPVAVNRNRDRVAVLIDVPVTRWAQGRQVHGATVQRVLSPPAPGRPRIAADGHATALSGVAAFVLAADCIPVAVAGQGAVATLHGGWRGLAEGILAEGVVALRELGAEGPLQAAIGPGVGPCCYEVGQEVHAAFAEHAGEARDGRRIDLKLIARRQLHAAGVTTVHDAGLCTMCAGGDLFFSHRRDGGVTGRQAGIAWRS